MFRKVLNRCECFSLVRVSTDLQMISKDISSILPTFLLSCVLFKAEDPSENYVKLRDYVLTKLCQGLPCFAADKLHLGFSADMVKETQDKLKINKV